ncbi:serine palmitoyltransferase [Stutzerimonas stutzeri]|uniref:serine palmitoyltransferase n=1 Tax=Stutzerimonas stutzeri TaxID=316 RepID=UPI002108B2B7|nr:aminotransferase class I/II-fold pyridoxal phosphate-dependent enzyme [Stutzerimonas stutzeri]MCQ4319279.1 aminotransferase class I/II-fold pyridoxal phosphate-dependent enzyme [Stutzerimonas stutzeri]
MALFDKFTKLAQERAALGQSGLNPFGTRIDEILSPTLGRIGDREVVLAGTNNYLGLTFDPGCIQAGQQALALEGTGTTGSRMANGSYGSHIALEAELAEFMQRQSVIVYSTGYLANLGVIGTLAGPSDIVLLDADCHASIYDACRLGGAQVIRFRHNDAKDLERRMLRLREQARSALIVVEGIYSMLGDRAPLAEIVEVKRRLGGYLLVDEAHSVGVLGPNGRGLAEELGVEGDVDIVLGTFSKSLGAIGGFAASRHADMELLRYASRPYIFTASSSPASIASVRAALRAVQNQPELRDRLWSNARHLYQELNALGYRTGPEPSPVVAVLLGSPHEGMAFWQRLIELGVYVNLVLPPATPGGQALVRCSVSAAHSSEQIDRIIQAFAHLRDCLPRTAAAGDDLVRTGGLA